MGGKGQVRFLPNVAQRLRRWAFLAIGVLVITGVFATLWSRPGGTLSIDTSSFAAAAQGPASGAATPLGEGMGIQVQPWYVKPDDLNSIAGAGFRVVRWGVAWDRVETKPGVYNWADMDRFMKALSSARLRSVIILGYGNPLYASAPAGPARSGPGQLVEARPPVTPKARAAFARFAATAAARYRDQNIIWEIWNEPDLAAFWRPKPDAASYAALAAETCTAIRAVAPKAKIVGGAGAALPNATAWQPRNIYSALIQNGAIRCLDGVSGHAYRMNDRYVQPDPESIVADITASRTYLYAKLKMPPEKAFIITEWGFTTHTISPNLQAAYLLRGNLANIASGIPLTVWYEWRDSRPDATDPESHFGLMTSYGGPKNNRNVQLVLARLAGANFIRVLPTNRADNFALQFRDSNSTFLIAWKRTNDEAARSRLSINGTYRATISFMPMIIEMGAAEAASVTIE